MYLINAYYLSINTPGMSDTLGDLIRRSGRTQSTCGISQVGASLIHRGLRRARGSTIARIAQALGVSTDLVAAACDESWRRAHLPSAPAVGPGTEGAAAVEVIHGAETTQEGGA